jgi:hypothetical protein
MRLLYMFNIGLVSHVGNGNNTLFWSDRWLMGCCISDLSPAVVEVVPLKTCQQCTVAEALLEQAWPADIREGFVHDWSVRILSTLGYDARHPAVLGGQSALMEARRLRAVHFQVCLLSFL